MYQYTTSGEKVPVSGFGGKSSKKWVSLFAIILAILLLWFAWRNYKGKPVFGYKF
jgi:uncharacterized integral membrane protein